MSDQTSFTNDQLRDFARRVIESATEDPDFAGVAEQLGDEWDHLAEDEFDRVHRAVHDLARAATVSVTWPCEEPADADA